MQTLSPEGRAHVGLASFLLFLLPELERKAETLARPVCIVSVVNDRERGGASVQLTTDRSPPRSRREIRALLDSLPRDTIVGWLR